jgi:Secretion system C-terminal sorting domain
MKNSVLLFSILLLPFISSEQFTRDSDAESGLLNFRGVRHSIIHLTWDDEQDNGFTHYIVERSLDGFQFAPVGTVTANTTPGRHSYVFSDTSSANYKSQRLYYQLQLLDQGGNTSYTKVLKFDKEKASLFIKVTPNPAEHDITISTDLPGPGPVTIIISDMKGSIVQQRKMDLATGTMAVTMEISKYSTGVYRASVQHGDIILQQLFIKK